MLKSITAFNKILDSLCTIQKSTWIDERGKYKPPSKRALETYKFISKRLQSLKPIKAEDIKKFFSPSDTANVNFFKEDKILYLPPMNKDAEDAEFVPIFSLCCNLSRDQSVARFRVILVTLDRNEKTKLNGIGFRMETPEGTDQNDSANGNDSTGIHNFYHAQLIQQFTPKQFGNILQSECPNWLPESQPSFPLPADCPVTLLLCIMITLYGWEYYKDFPLPGIEHYQKKLAEKMGKKRTR